jgi:DNA-binding response OmpR family regulator
MRQVWETNYMGDTRTLDVHIRWVREAIEQNPQSPKHIITVRGKGYRFDPTPLTTHR